MSDRSIYEQILDSLNSLTGRLSRFERRENAARADAEARSRDIRRQRDYQKRISKQSRWNTLQAEVDAVLQLYNVSAPGPRADDSERSYRVRLLGLVQDQLPPRLDKNVVVSSRGDSANVTEMARFPIGRVDDAVIDIIQPQILTMARRLAHDPASVPEDEWREVHRLGPGGQDVTEFIGRRSFVRDYTQSKRVKITDPIALAAVQRGLVRF
jgi:hypothetical protein